jgi:hypothetical protein
MGGVGDTKTLQSAFDTLPGLAVVQPAGQPLHVMPPDAFLYVPTRQGTQLKVAIANACPALHEVFPKSQFSSEITSASASLRLYTSTV